ncbi:MAG: phosphoribosyltransferase [Thermoanaerobaculia bacterium]
MSIVLTSPSVIAPGNAVDHGLAGALRQLGSGHTPVAVVSNGPRPAWFAGEFPGDAVTFVQRQGRQDGTIIADLSKEFEIPCHDFLVLGAIDEDVQMAKNGRGVLLSAGWLPLSPAARYGISVLTAEEFLAVVKLVESWPGSWYFEGSEPLYAVRALTNVSGMNVTDAQAAWAKRVVNAVKNGGPRLQALLVVGARSLLQSGGDSTHDLMFGLYPSSGSANNDTEVLSDFTHRLRTTTSRVRFAKKATPLLIRHVASTKRSRGGVTDRADPREQIETLHLNPFYRGKVTGRHVILLDDCTTYGVSFGVAASLLRAAGAEAVTCVALGKFGNQLRYFEIALTGDPFAPVAAGNYTVTSRPFAGVRHNEAQSALQELIK